MDFASYKIKLTLRGFPCGSTGKESACNAGDLDSIPGLGRSLGEGNSYPPQYSGLENSMNCIAYGVAESDMTERLSLNFTSGTLGELNNTKHVMVLRTVLKGILSFVLIINK